MEEIDNKGSKERGSWGTVSPEDKTCFGIGESWECSQFSNSKEQRNHRGRKKKKEKKKKHIPHIEKKQGPGTAGKNHKSKRKKKTG